MRISDLVRQAQAASSVRFQGARPNRFVLELGRKLSSQKPMSSLARLVNAEGKFIDRSLASTEIWKPGQKQWVDSH